MDTSGFSEEQLAFMRRRAAETGQPVSFGAASPAQTSDPSGFSEEQLAFMRRKASETGGVGAVAASGAATRGYMPRYAPTYQQRFVQTSDDVLSAPAVCLVAFLAGFAACFAVLRIFSARGDYPLLAK
jgi:hypothetical protein